MRRIYVVGGAITPFIGNKHPDFIWKKHPEFGKRENPVLEDYIQKSVDGALKSTGVDPNVIDRLAIGNFTGELFCNQGHLGAALVGANPAFRFKPSTRTEGACASGALALQVCYDALRAGDDDIAMAVGVEVQTTVTARIGGDYLARASHYRRQRGIDDFTFPCLFAKRTKHIASSGHFTMEDMARVAAKAYANGNKNPLAHMHHVKMTLDEANTVSQSNPCFLGNAEYKDFLRIADCSQVSDGGAAIVVATEEGLRKIGKKPQDCVELLSLQVAVNNLYEDPDDYTRMPTSAAAAAKAFDKAGVKPQDIQVAEVHDCFTTAELLMYEALGIAPYGGAKKLVRDGETLLEGKYPTNTGGGLLSFGHPVGATGIKQVMEIFRQMKGQCGNYQLKRIPALGATLNMGGDDRTAVACVLKNQ